MIIAITGSSGFIGRRFIERAKAEGHSCRAVSLRAAPTPDALGGCDAVVHLAGEPVAQHWTAAAKKRIFDSRETGTRMLVDAMRANPPRVLVSASGIGYYGSRGDDVLTEKEPAGTDFLAGVCVAWEREAQNAEKLGTRVVLLRIGMVLGAKGGALQKMLTPFRLGVGGRIGSGRQWMSWIHIDDLCDLILFALREGGVSGAVNATSSNPVTNAGFTRALASALHRPAIFPVPPIALKLLFGEMSEVLLDSQRAVPEAALRSGFNFGYPELGAALRNVLAPG